MVDYCNFQTGLVFILNLKKKFTLLLSLVFPEFAVSFCSRKIPIFRRAEIHTKLDPLLHNNVLNIKQDFDSTYSDIRALVLAIL